MTPRRMMKSLYAIITLLLAAAMVEAAQEEDAQSRIIGGTDAPPGRYPYMVHMTEYGAHKCGGTLVAPDVVLTVAHCVGFFNEVQLGRYSLTQTTPYERYLVQELVTHPRFYSNSPAENDPYDFCLVKFYGASQMPLVRLNRDPTLPAQTGDDLVVTGWGTSDPITFFPPATDILQEATVQYISNDECIDLTPRAIDVTLCALGDGKDSCTGDSGGPILLKMAENDDDLQVGITSSGVSGCADKVLPGLYARTSEAMDWIDEELCRLSSNPPEDFGCPDIPRDVVVPSDNETTTLIVIEIDLDAFPEQTSWILQSTNEYGVNVTYASQPFFAYSNSSSTVVTEEVLLPDNQEYTLILLDLFGNGMCCKQGGLIIREEQSNIIYVVATHTDLQSYSAVTFDFVVGTLPTDAPTTTPAPSATFFPSSSPTMTRPFVTLEIVFDSRSVETGWLLEVIVAEQQDVLVTASYPGAYAKYAENSSVTEQIFLKSPGIEEPTNYRFTMTDNEGNGLCCGASGNGTARLYAGSSDNNVLLRDFGDFYYEDEFLFSDGEVAATVAPATMAPAIIMVPENSTMAPVTIVPENKTMAPATIAPEENTTMAPVALLTKPPATAAPVESTKAPAITPTVPATTTSAPVTSAPATTTTFPATASPVAVQPVTAAPTLASSARRAAPSSILFVLVVLTALVL